jgi:hypothetical protein
MITPSLQPQLSSMVCQAAHFDTEWFARWAGQIWSGPSYRHAWSPPTRLANLKAMLLPPRLHRKMWEFCAISEVLYQRGMLVPGKRGIGFAVGKEPLSCLFAGYGASILATDLDTTETNDAWAKTGQQVTSLDQIFHPELIDEARFRSLVSFQEVDMRDLRTLKNQKADFLWSSCSFEHLGTLKKGLDYVEEAMSFLVPGGLAVHTTEYNVWSNNKTIEEGDFVIYRRRDIEELAMRLRSKGYILETPDFRSGRRLADIIPDRVPYQAKQHVKLKLGRFVATSMVLVIRKG